MHLLKQSCSLFGFTNINLNLNLNVDLKKYYIFNTMISNFDLHNVFLIIGTNPKLDSPILNMKIKHLKYKFNKKIKLGYIGSRILINYSLNHIGLTNKSLINLLYGKSFFCKVIKKCFNILCLFSHSISYLNNSLFFSLFNTLSSNLKTQYFICNTLSLYSNDINLSELCLLSYYYSISNYIVKKKKKIIYLLGVDFQNMVIPSSSYVIYQGHHGDKGILNANIVLPSNLYIENTSFFFNCEGRLFVSNIAINKIKKIKNDSNILYNLFILLFNVSFNYYIGLISSFFYKIVSFFKKQHFNIPFILKNNNYTMWLSKNITTIKHSFFKMDVISKHSFYLSKENINHSNNFNYLTNYEY
jgi:NADH dehydrogenase/NADH:ubiquinone oxidoreductase subunit G